MGGRAVHSWKLAKRRGLLRAQSDGMFGDSLDMGSTQHVNPTQASSESQ